MLLQKVIEVKNGHRNAFKTTSMHTQMHIYISIPHHTHMVHTPQIEYFVVLSSTVLFVKILQRRWYK